MFVIKRDGRKQKVYFDKITARLKKLVYGLNQDFVDVVKVSQKVIAGLYAGVKTQELDELAAQTAAYMATEHPDYAILAARIAVSNLHLSTLKSFSETMVRLHEYVDELTDRPSKLIADDVMEIILKNSDLLDGAIVYDRDYQYDYFGFKTLERSYLLRINGVIAERPQHMLMRVAVGIHKSDIDSAIQTYNYMSKKYFTHASPTLFNAGTPRPQLSSCFLVAMKDDSIDGIFDTVKECAMISKTAGGIGMHCSNIRASGSYIRGTNGNSNGLVPMLRVFNSTARYVDQGGGKRPGAFAVYLEPWHADLIPFLDLKKNNGNEELRARDLFYALWISDLFMKRVEEEGSWSFFCPTEAPGLADAVGQEFEDLYTKYEGQGRAKSVMPAREVWMAVMQAQIETGTPYILYKDSCNLKSNQKNLGVIKSSNLCTEVIEYSDADETAVCNLASISLPKFVEDGRYDFQALADVVGVMTRNLNKVIDVNYYPVESARRSNLRHRPIGLGVQGLADVFMKLHMPFESAEARQLNKDIFETIYYGAMNASCELAEQEGTYESYAGCPVSKGEFQYDMWGVTPSTRWNWAALKERVAKHGVRNSLLVAPMPTASTSQILGNCECFEPYQSNIFSRRVLAGEFAVVNPHLLRELTDLGLWTPELKQSVIKNNGSVQGLPTIPAEIQAVYKTAWEIKQRAIIDMAADRGAFIDQSQSLNLFVEKPNFAKLTSMHFYAWKKGLKTGCYYLRTRSATDAIKFTVEQGTASTTETKAKQMADIVCSLENREACISCSG